MQIRTGQINPNSEEWSPWTPVWGGLTVGNGTVKAFYKQIGKTVHYQANLVFGSTTTLGTSVDTTFSLPVNASSNYATSQGIGSMQLNISPNLIQGVVFRSSATTALVNAYKVSSSAVITGAVDTNNFTTTTGTVLSVNGTYEVD